jgi:2-oxoglutarate ferredoxin oxidoreductase subunit alpha
MIYGAAACGRRVMTSSSSPGISLKQEGISYIAATELPCLVVNVVRGGPGLGTIQPAQSDYFQATKGGGHGDYRLLVLAPASVQETSDFVELAFDLAFKYRNPVMILSDGVIGQMMEKVELKPQRSRLTEFPKWSVSGKKADRERIIITSLELDPHKQELINLRIQAKYKRMQEEEVRYEKILCDDADYLIAAFGSSARICQKAIQIGREKGIKVGLFRPITLFPYPSKQLAKLADQ